MTDDLGKFLDRDPEIAAFTGLLDHPDRRLLLLHGPRGRGKSRLLRQLREHCCDENTVSTLVDFEYEPSLTEPDRVIDRLREQIGGRFDEEMGEEEARIADTLAASRERSLERLTEAVARGSRAGAGGAGGGAHIDGDVKAARDFIGRDQNVYFPNAKVELTPGGGPAEADEEADTERNKAFRTALGNLQETQKVILFFDHFEKAKEPVRTWLREHVVTLHLEGSPQFANVWSVIAGRTVPLQDQEDRLYDRLRSLAIGPLPEKDVIGFWVDQIGLDRTAVQDEYRSSQGNTQMLCLHLRERAELPRGEQSSG